MNTGRNEGGIRRGDREDPGGLEARPKDGTAPDGSAGADADELADADMQDLTIHDADDPALGLTGIGGVPSEDWAADAGPTRTGEGASHGIDSRLADQSRAPSGRAIDFESDDRE